MMDDNVTQEAKRLIDECGFYLPLPIVKQLLELTALSLDELLLFLVILQKEYAHCAISKYQVAAVALGSSQAIYLGVNFEFPGFPLNQSIHAEQAVVSLIRQRGDGLVKMALSAAPCGHCRQFLYEIGYDFDILQADSPTLNLHALLNHAFGPQDLGIEATLLSPSRQSDITHDDPLVAKALQAAYHSYVPYTHSYSGVALQLFDGTIVTGSYLENAAYNPIIAPLQGAFIELAACGSHYKDIKRAVLAESSSAKASHALITKAMLEQFAPHADFQLVVTTLFENRG